MEGIAKVQKRRVCVKDQWMDQLMMEQSSFSQTRPFRWSLNRQTDCRGPGRVISITQVRVWLLPIRPRSRGHP